MTITNWVKLLPIAIRRTATTILAAAAVQTPALAQTRPLFHAGHGGAESNPVLHINTRWKECSFQLDSSLTQAAWRQFTGEAAVVTYFRPLTGASPMGAGKFELSLMQWQSGIDDSDSAWNDTFVHPDSTHWLFEGDGLQFPGMAARLGVSSRTDVGMYFTKNPRANYGFYGAQLQQNLTREGWRKMSAAARVSFVKMFGPEDLDFTVYGADVLASREFGLWAGRASLSPYALLSGSLGRSHEKSAIVDLDDESVFGAQATAGVEARLWNARIAAEYGFARVSSLSLKVGVGL